MLMKASCPEFGKQRLEMRLSCELGTECTCRATCADCHLEFEVQTGSAPSAVAALLPNLVCPECSHKGASFGMVCVTVSRTCEPVVACDKCNHVYVKAK